MTSNSVWKSLYRIIRLDVIQSFGVESDVENREAFDVAAQSVILACNKVLRQIESPDLSEITVVVNDVAKGLRAISDFAKSDGTKAHFEELAVAVEAHLEYFHKGRTE